MKMSIQDDKHTMQTGNDDSIPLNLRDFVERFHVCWEALPDYYYVGKKKRQIGFQLELSGTHEPGVQHPEPGCQHCRKVWAALKSIAEWIIPKEIRASAYDVDPYDQSIHYDPSRAFRADISLKIVIRHRSGFDSEVDGCELRCLNEMKGRLKEIGARERVWGQEL